MHQSYPETFRWKLERERFSEAMRQVAPGLTSVEMVALFAGRATPSQIRSWRLARCGPPQWAVDAIAERLRTRAAIDLETAASLSAGPRHGGAIGTRALHRYRLQRALEREKGTV